MLPASVAYLGSSSHSSCPTAHISTLQGTVGPSNSDLSLTTWYFACSEQTKSLLNSTWSDVILKASSIGYKLLNFNFKVYIDSENIMICDL
ncbi:hypothetical protein WICMUC_003021 [Wickerhamomyces mucosus]|uniref:Uncharacterized protein n=1 Tax=Wickerhamomyces mucosus TaxID=1378264 RepID=A0A9P8PM52_9ASCO|nr:hypothetical protein WICMUC_003021 [Wickerhamomyces mucosus]